VCRDRQRLPYSAATDTALGRRLIRLNGRETYGGHQKARRSGRSGVVAPPLDVAAPWLIPMTEHAMTRAGHPYLALSAGFRLTDLH
jgi:hypothetical protein